MTDRLTTAQIAALDELERNATKAPWYHYGSCVSFSKQVVGDAGACYEVGVVPPKVWGLGVKDAKLIVALRNAAPALLETITELTRERDAVVENTIRVLSRDCDGKHDKNLTYDAFVAAGGDQCPMCLKDEISRLQARIAQAEKLAAVAEEVAEHVHGEGRDDGDDGLIIHWATAPGGTLQRFVDAVNEWQEGGGGTTT